MAYFWWKWLHIIAIISWMAGILYLYRLFINIRERGEHPEVFKVLVGMSWRLYKYITMPAMVVSFVAGLAMVAVNPGIAAGGWFATKFVFVLALAGATGYAKSLLRRIEAKDDNLPSPKKLRFLNEVPTLLMLVIVYLVVFKPF